MVRPGQEVLTGRVEVDETFIGGEEAGPRGRGALGKTLVVIAVELREPRGYGRARMSIIPNAEAKPLRTFLTGHNRARLHRGFRRLVRLSQGVHRLV